MLEAVGRSAYQEHTLEALPAARRNRRRSKGTSGTKNRLCVLAAIAIFFGFALYYTSLSAIIASKGYQLEQVKAEISRLKTANERLELTLASMSSLDKVEKIAVEKLGMEKPVSDGAALVVSGPSIPVKATDEEETEAVDDKKLEGAALSLSNLCEAIKGLFVPESAQASSSNK